MKIKKEENFSRGVMICLLLIVALLFAVVCTGCATVYGMASDTETGAGVVRQWLTPTVEKQKEARWLQAKKEQQAKVQKAADLVLAEKGVKSQ